MSEHLLNPGHVKVVGSRRAEAWCYDERDGLHVFVEAPGEPMPIVLRITPGTLRKALATARRGT